MSRIATVRRKQKLPVIESCHECPWIKPCGGYRGQPELFANSCFARHCCGGRDECNYLCPKNSKFVRMMNEVKGLRFETLPEMAQARVRLPVYVPSVLHHYSRDGALNVDFAAIPVEQ